ncbi:MAG: sugar-transfer associated ATP-grasp domain-containing protein [Pseudomonadota bacterium]
MRVLTPIFRTFAKYHARSTARHYDRDHALEAAEAYQRIVHAAPDHALSPATRRDIRKHAKKRFGGAEYAPWLEVYAAWQGRFVPGCIPDNYFGRYIARAFGNTLIKAKNTTVPLLLPRSPFPDLAYVIRGTLFDRDFRPIEPKPFARKAFEAYPYLYVKAQDSLRGHGVQRATPETLSEILSATENACVQYPVTPHSELSRLSPDAVPTLRITTTNVGGHVRPVGATLRLGQMGETHVQSQSAMRISVDLGSGQLFATGALANWTPIRSHPDTGHVFSHITIPNFHEARRLVVELHGRLPHFFVLGWDVVVTNRGDIKVFEVNSGHTDIKFHEANHGPIFDTPRLDRMHVKGAIAAHLPDRF